MSYGFDAFGAYTQAALTDPTAGGDEIIRRLKFRASLDSANNYINQDAGYNMKFDPNYFNFAISSNPSQFATVTLSTLLDGSDGLDKDSKLYSMGVGLNAYLNNSFMNSMNADNPFNTAWDNNQFKFNFTDNSIKTNLPSWDKINTNWDFSLTPGSGVSASGQNVDYSKNSEKANFNKAVALIKAYGEEVDKSYDNKIDKVIKDMNGNYKTGLAKLKAIIATFDQKKLTKVIREISHKIYDEQESKGKAISDNWANQISNATSKSGFKVDTSGVNKDNVLHVLGTYISNPKFKTGGMWNALIKNNYDDISKALIENGKEFLKSGKCTNETTKHKIKGYISSLGKDGDVSSKVSVVYNLFNILRYENAAYNDNKTAKIVGGGAVPSNKIETTPDNYQTKKYQAEKNAYNSASKLNTKG